MANLKELTTKTIFEVSLHSKFDAMMRLANSQDDTRTGLHASAVITDDTEFCYRELVLNYFFKPAPVIHSTRLLRIFAHGNAVHDKWQNIFIKAGVAEQIEGRHYHAKYDVYLTPDAVITLNNKRYVVEIKSMNTYQFKKMQRPEIRFIRQVNFYMHFLNIDDGIILVEDKNDQEIKLFYQKYDISYVETAIKRMENIQKLRRYYEKTGKLPMRICEHSTDKRAERCPLQKPCFEKRRVN